MIKTAGYRKIAAGIPHFSQAGKVRACDGIDVLAMREFLVRMEFKLVIGRNGIPMSNILRFE
jgi:hypothetical protein